MSDSRCAKCFKPIDFKESWCKLEQFFYHYACYWKQNKEFLHSTKPDFIHRKGEKPL